MQNIPADILINEIITKNLELDVIYSLCLDTKVNKSWLQRCNNAEFWRKIGQSRYPELIELLIPRLDVSIGKFYHDFAILLYYLNDVLYKEDYIHLIGDNISKPEDPVIMDIFGNLFLENTELVTVDYYISRLQNGKYGISGSIHRWEEKGGRAVTPLSLSSDEFIKYILSLYISSVSSYPEFISKQENKKFNDAWSAVDNDLIPLED